MLYTMKEILTDAQETGYGVGYFNAVNMEMVRAYIRAAEQCQSPIIIGTAEALMPYADFNWIVPIMLEQARRAKVPVAVHLDHTYSFELLMQCMEQNAPARHITVPFTLSARESVRKITD